MTDFKIKYIGWNMGQYGKERSETMADIEILELTIDDVDILKQLEAIGKICYSKRAPANEKIADIIHILEVEG